MTTEEAIAELEQVSKEAEELADWQRDIVTAVMSGKYKLNAHHARMHGKASVAKLCRRVDAALEELGG